jgi:two-component system cell cycle sensor histidine kinase/response regulator CckA
MILMDTDPSHPGTEKLNNVERLVKEGAQLTKEHLGLALGGKYEVIPTDLNDLVARSSDLFGRTKKEIRIQKEFQNNPWTAEVDRSQIEQALLNLYVNAWQAMPAGGNLYLETGNINLDEFYVRPFGLPAGRYVRISVTDSGVGMDEETQKRIFDPFFTTKDIGRGTGLGLASAYGIIKNHRGIINVYSEKGQGTTFNIYLPASNKPIRPEFEKSPELIYGTETILFVDDEPAITQVGRGLLTRLGYEVIIAASGQEAIEIYRGEWKRIDLVVLDMIMPGLGGGETFDRLKEINPAVAVILSSGYSMNGQAKMILERGCRGFLQKPFNLADLSKKIRQVLNS